MNKNTKIMNTISALLLAAVVSVGVHVTKFCTLSIKTADKKEISGSAIIEPNRDKQNADTISESAIYYNEENSKE